MLAGRGPGVKIRISSIGNVETDLKSEFTTQGINQTLHRVYLEVKCRVNILTPFQDIEKEITNQVLLIENVIVGRIPETYYNLEGLTGTTEAMEVIE
ncbi:MAG: sporulation protein YunB [Clostridia bacterium]